CGRGTRRRSVGPHNRRRRWSMTGARLRRGWCWERRFVQTRGHGVAVDEEVVVLGGAANPTGDGCMRGRVNGTLGNVGEGHRPLSPGWCETDILGRMYGR